jgi:hypothetical protein
MSRSARKSPNVCPFSRYSASSSLRRLASARALNAPSIRAAKARLYATIWLHLKSRNTAAQRLFRAARSQAPLRPAPNALASALRITAPQAATEILRNITHIRAQLGSAVRLDELRALWTQVVLRLFPNPLRVNGRRVLVGDGIKAPKRSKKMLWGQIATSAV